MGLASFSSGEPYDDDDSGFLADNNHPLLAGQSKNGMGPYKRVFVEHKIQRQVRRGFAAGVPRFVVVMSLVSVGSPEAVRQQWLCCK